MEGKGQVVLRWVDGGRGPGNRLWTLVLPLVPACASVAVPVATAPPVDSPMPPREARFDGSQYITSGSDSLQMVLVRETEIILVGWGVDTVSVDAGSGMIRRVLHLDSPILGGAEHHVVLDSVDGFLPLQYEAHTPLRSISAFFGNTSVTVTTDDMQSGSRESIDMPTGDSTVVFPSLEFVVRGLDPTIGTKLRGAAFYAGWSGFLPFELEVVDTVHVSELPDEALWKVSGDVAGLPAAFFVGVNTHKLWYWWWDTDQGQLWVRPARLNELPRGR